jgi:hypothetical protein
LRLPKEQHSALKTFLLYLNIMPELVRGVDGTNLKSSDIMVDLNIAKALREI